MNKKPDKWITITKYVDPLTGEQLTKNEVEQNYIIERKTKITYNEYRYYNRKRETWRITEYTNECTRNGKQIKIW